MLCSYSMWSRVNLTDMAAIRFIVTFTTRESRVWQTPTAGLIKSFARACFKEQVALIAIQQLDLFILKLPRYRPSPNPPTPSPTTTMQSLRAIGASLFVLLAVANGQDATPRQSAANVTESDNGVLLTAINDVDSYSSDISTLVCIYTVNNLQVKKDTYNYSVTGCKVDPEFVGRCPDLTTFPGCGSYNVVITSKSKSKKPKVKSITKASK
ncbi:hypothetical protein V7S43_016493 [Phytophthora oleae]|uniref:Uncharacterized protein n=1 Tax=Phytophthora oleae TaxID=2107226 RepID=A0ABD3F094_9STRA